MLLRDHYNYENTSDTHGLAYKALLTRPMWVLLHSLQREELGALTLGHIKTSQRRTIIQQYGDCYTGRWWVGCYIWYYEEGSGRAAAPPIPFLAVPNVTAHPSTANVPTSFIPIDVELHFNGLSCWLVKIEL